MIENGTDVQKRPCGHGQLQFGFGIETGVFCHNISFLRVGDINSCSICCKSFETVCLRGKYLWGGSVWETASVAGVWLCVAEG